MSVENIMTTTKKQAPEERYVSRNNTMNITYHQAPEERYVSRKYNDDHQKASSEERHVI